MLTDRQSVYSETALKHLSELRPAPSVGLQDVPRESLGEHLGFSSRELQPDDLDEKLAREFILSSRIALAEPIPSL